MIFHFFDPTDTGHINIDSFKKGCAELNKALSWGRTIKEMDIIFSLLDISGDKRISVNEFFEVFRVVDLRASKRVFLLPAGKANGGEDNSSLSSINIEGIVINCDSDREFSSRMPKVVLQGPGLL